MSTPPEHPIVIGEIWTLNQDLGVGLGSIPSGSEVTIEDYLEPYSPGVGQTDEWTVVSDYTYYETMQGPGGVPYEVERHRRLAYPESEFRTYFNPPPEVP